MAATKPPSTNPTVSPQAPAGCDGVDDDIKAHAWHLFTQIISLKPLGLPREGLNPNTAPALLAELNGILAELGRLQRIGVALKTAQGRAEGGRGGRRPPLSWK